MLDATASADGSPSDVPTCIGDGTQAEGSIRSMEEHLRRRCVNPIPWLQEEGENGRTVREVAGPADTFENECAGRGTRRSGYGVMP